MMPDLTSEVRVMSDQMASAVKVFTHCLLEAEVFLPKCKDEGECLTPSHRLTDHS